MGPILKKIDPKDLLNICLIIDVDGFPIQQASKEKGKKKLYIREMGYASLTKYTIGSFRFDLKKYFNSLSDVDHISASYCKYNVHGLTFRPQPKEKDVRPEDEVTKIILEIYNKSKTFDKNVVAYKGGQHEEDILYKLQIPYLNLEDYGCPKFEELPIPTIKDCGWHLPIKKAHCPKVECAAFAVWTRKKIQQLSN